MKYFLLLIMVWGLQYDTAAQSYDTTDIAASITPNSTFRYLELATIYSEKSDSISASVAFLKVNPYCLLALKQTPYTLNRFLTKYLLTVSTKDTYLTIFTQAYHETKSPAYRFFEELYFKHNATRNKIDTFTGHVVNALEAEISTVDSINFDKLYSYTQKNGWPSIEDGSLYAFTIALQDYEHYPYYFPIIKKAVTNGLLSVNHLKQMYIRSIHLGPPFTDVRKLQKREHISFNVNGMLKGEIPNFLKEIQDSIKINCPIKSIHILHQTNYVNAEDGYSKPSETNYIETHREEFKKQYLEKIVSLPGLCTSDINKHKLSMFWLLSDIKRSTLTLIIVL